MLARSLFLRPVLGLGIAVMAFPALGFNSVTLDAAIAAKVVEGRERSMAMTYLRDIAEGIGPRLTGSPKLDEALDYAADVFRSLGLEPVFETYGELPVGFQRGERQMVRMVEPFTANFEFSTRAWTVGTDGLVRGRVLDRPESDGEVRRRAAEFAGAWVLMPEEVGLRGAQGANLDPIDQALVDAGIVGRLYGSPNEYVTTGGSPVSQIPTSGIPNVLVTKANADLMREQLARGREVVVEADIENNFLEGPRPMRNLYADIRGSEFPDEYVVIIAHIDSWDGPGSQGAADNGIGTVVALEAARLIQRMGHQPRRTIRFLLVTGEEQGLWGSRAYVQMHADKMARTSAVINEDAGPGWHSAVSALPSFADDIRRIMEPVANAFEGMPIGVVERESLWAQGGSDHAPFTWVGVPALQRTKGGGYPYARIWHTQFDRMAEINPAALRQMATGTAVLAFGIANLDDVLPRLEDDRAAPNYAPIPGFVLN